MRRFWRAPAYTAGVFIIGKYNVLNLDLNAVNTGRLFHYLRGKATNRGFYLKEGLKQPVKEKGSQEKGVKGFYLTGQYY